MAFLDFSRIEGLLSTGLAYIHLPESVDANRLRADHQCVYQPVLSLTASSSYSSLSYGRVIRKRTRAVQSSSSLTHYESQRS